MARTAIGSRVDKLYKLVEEKRLQSKKLKGVEERIRELESEIRTMLKKDKLEGAVGTTAQVKTGVKHIPIVDDWKKVQAFIIRNKAFSILQKRLSSTAIEEMVEHRRKPIPGIGYLAVDTMSITKRAQKKKAPANARKARSK